MPAKDGLIILEVGLTLLKKKKVQITGETASDDQQAADGFPNTIKKITKKKRYQPR